MDQRRFVAFLVLSMAIMIGWQALTARRQPNKPAAAQQGQAADRVPRDAGNDEPRKEARERQVAENEDADQADQQQPELPQFPLKTVDLGSADPGTGYRQLVTLSSTGAAIEHVRLSDPRYTKLEKPHPPLVVLGEHDVTPRTFEIKVPQVRAAVDELNWELVNVAPAQGPHASAEFKLTIGDVEIVKRYEVQKVDPNGPRPEAAAYELKLDLTFRNRGKKPHTVNYVLQGPTGLPLENVDNTTKFRDVVVGFQTGPSKVDYQILTGKAIADGKDEEWKKPVNYIGTDAQFFAALVCPAEDQEQSPYTSSIRQQLIEKDKLHPERSEVSVELTSVDLSLAKAGAADDKDSATHSYLLFAGPKRKDVLPEFSGRIIDYGTFLWLFHIDFISESLLAVLKFFHFLTGSWGIAIVCLTCVVRGCMFPVSIKQARGAAKMQALQPEIAALKEKYGKDREQLMRAQMELFRKHKYHPMAGCLPLILQLPVFIGLYQALNHAVDLRLASFLWIDNLAAPDALFRIPFPLPLFGQQDFNLLPLITTALFVVQQKMFMPPPMNEEEAMRNRMMTYMTIGMGILFYKVPAGLCVYFIASSLWGMGERKLLPKAKPGALPPERGERQIGRGDSDDRDPPSDRRRGRDGDNDDDDDGGGLWSRLLKAAEKQTAARRAQIPKRRESPRNPRG